MLKILKYDIMEKAWIFLSYPLLALFTVVLFSLGINTTLNTVFVGLTIAYGSIIQIFLLATLHRDLNTKKGYLTFLTPVKPYQYLLSQILTISLGVAIYLVATILLGFFITYMHVGGVTLMGPYSFYAPASLIIFTLLIFVQAVTSLCLALCVAKIFNFGTFLTYLVGFGLVTAINWIVSWVEFGFIALFTNSPTTSIWLNFVAFIDPSSFGMVLFLAVKAICCVAMFMTASKVLEKRVSL